MKRVEEAAKAKPKAKPAGSEAKTGKPASQLIDQRIRALGDWRGDTLARMRALILAADPGMTEEWKWVKATSPGTPVWSHHGSQRTHGVVHFRRSAVIHKVLTIDINGDTG